MTQFADTIRPLATVLITALLAGAGATSARIRFASAESVISADSCSVAVLDQHPVTLETGSHVSVDVSGVAVNGNTVIVVGSDTHIWPSGVARDSSSPIGERTAIGVLRDASGRLSIVPSPMPDERILTPRVASAGSVGWDVIFVTMADTARQVGRWLNANLWYGRFDGRAWHDISQLGGVRSAYLSNNSTSDLVSVRGALYFAFPYDRTVELHASPAGSSGLVMLKRRGGRWTFDTLPTWRGPDQVQLAPNADSATVSAAIAQVFFENHRSHHSSLFVVKYDSAWHEPQLAVTDSSTSQRYVADPKIRVAGTRTLVAWVTGPAGAAFSARRNIEWAMVPSDVRALVARPLESKSLLDVFDLTTWDEHRTLWFLRDGDSNSQVRVLMTDTAATSDLGVVVAPLDNYGPIAWALPDHTVLLITGKRGVAEDEAPAATYFTRLTVSCSQRN